MKKLTLFSLVIILFSSCGVIFYKGQYYRPVRMINVSSIIDSSQYRMKKLNNVSAETSSISNSEPTELRKLKLDSLRAKVNREELYFEGRKIYPNIISEKKSRSVASVTNSTLINVSSIIVGSTIGGGKTNYNYNYNDNSTITPNRIIGYVKYEKHKTWVYSLLFITLGVIGIAALVFLAFIAYVFFAVVGF